MKDKGQCVQCGFCCTQGPCRHGRRHAMRFADKYPNRCVFLTRDMKCMKYADIRKQEKGSKFTMFGCGCSSTMFNEVRDAKIARDSQSEANSGKAYRESSILAEIQNRQS